MADDIRPTGPAQPPQPAPSDRVPRRRRGGTKLPAVRWLAVQRGALVLILLGGAVMLFGASSWPDPLSSSQKELLDLTGKICSIAALAILGLASVRKQ